MNASQETRRPAHRLGILATLLATSALSFVLAAPSRALADQRSFASPEEAEKALLDAAKAKDHAAVDAIFGPGAKDLLSGDAVADAAAFEAFSKACGEMAKLSKEGDGKAVICIGRENWPFPIPIVKGADGKWLFDTAAGKEEILNRQVGENEIHTIEVCREYAKAQREYASKDRDGDEVLEYATKFKSAAGQKDGLSWEAAAGEEPSPFGPVLAEAHAEGYKGISSHGKRPFHGYLFRILTRQGADAPGGAYDYIINGNMIGGFALVAYPAVWGQSGVMTFIINQQGKVFEKNLGEKTLDAAAAMTEYNPDKSWRVVVKN